MLVRRSTPRERRAGRRGSWWPPPYPDGTGVKVGAEIPLGAGEIGFAAESQMVVNRQDLQSETARSRIKPDPGLPGMPELT